MGAEDIEKVLGRSLPIMILRNKAKEVLNKDSYFKVFSKELQEKIIDCFKIKNFNEG